MSMRSVAAICVAVGAGVAALGTVRAALEATPVRKAKTRDTRAAASTGAAHATSVPDQPSVGFAPQARLGFTAGDQWEPAIATDDFGGVYVLYPQYGGVPGCASCPSPTMILHVSRDGGATWEPPRLIAPPGTGQWDAQIEVDPLDGRTLVASWLQDGKSDTVVARSLDGGLTWTTVVADHTNAGTDKPILVVRGADVYVAFNHAQKALVAASHDGGASFTTTTVNLNGKLGWSLAGGGAIDAAGRVFFAWAGYEQNGGAKGKVNLFISRSSDGGASWTSSLVAVSAAPPDCAAYNCGWAYLGAQLTLAADEAGALYALWNAGAVNGGPERIYFARSSDAGASWSGALDVSSAPVGTAHAFPAVAARAAGDVRLGWMDARNGGAWNVYSRRSTDGGATWSAEQTLSSYVPGYTYISAAGFRFPFGDYWEMAIDGQGTSHAVWGEGYDYVAPGSIWYTRGQ